MGLPDLTIADAARAIESRDVSPRELIEACLERAEVMEPVIGAFSALDAEGALWSAHRLGEELVRTGPRSPVHGVPVGIKDLIDVEGLPTTAGSTVLPKEPVRQDAPVVHRLREAGAVIMGKTNAHEFAYGAITPPTRNPWDVDRIPGGSSGGSAAAVAAGECLGALGTDTAGSIRIPAAFCGVSGLVPRKATLPLGGIVPLSWSFDRCGPIARTAEDLLILLGALAVGDIGLHRVPDFSGMRVGTPPDVGQTSGVGPEVEEATVAAVELMRRHGATAVDIELPALGEWDRPSGLRLMVEALVAHQEAGWYPDEADKYGGDTLASLRFAEGIAASRIVAGDRQLRALEQRVLGAMKDIDVLVLPTTPIVAPTVAEMEAAAADGSHKEIVGALTRMGAFVNCTNLAAATVPSGYSPQGLPMGIQFIGRNEREVLAPALSFQRIADFHTRRPRAIAVGDR